MTTLAQAIQRVRFLIDDRDANPLVSDADITTALQVAQEEVWQKVVASGINIYTQSGLITTDGAGEGDLTALNPLSIANVAWQSGSTFFQVPPARIFEGVMNVNTPTPLKITYVPRAAFPVLPGDPFVWAQAAISSATLDQAMCTVAATEVWVLTGEPPLQSLVTRRDELLLSVTTQISQPRWSVTRPAARLGHGFMWRLSAHNKIQLVY